MIQKGALFEKYFEAEKLSVDESEELLKIFADYVNANKPDKYKKDSPKDVCSYAISLQGRRKSVRKFSIRANPSDPVL